MGYTHVDDQRTWKSRERRPIEASVAGIGFRITVTGDERDGRRHRTVSQGDPRVGCHAHPCGDARHDLEVDPSRAEVERFLRATSEHQWITPLQPDHGSARPRMLYHDLVNVRLAE